MEYPQDQFIYDELVRLWLEHRSRPFPAGGLEVEGMLLVTFDEALFVMVGAYIRHRVLKPRNVRILSELSNDLRRVLPLLPEGMTEYFAAWDRLVRVTLYLATGGSDGNHGADDIHALLS